jgi:hypothetical protein
MALDLRYQFIQTISDRQDDDKHVTIRLFVALDQNNTMCDVSLEVLCSVTKYTNIKLALRSQENHDMRQNNL